MPSSQVKGGQVKKVFEFCKLQQDALKSPAGKKGIPPYWADFIAQIALPIHIGIIDWIIKTVPPNSTIAFLSRDGFLGYNILKRLQSLPAVKQKKLRIIYLPVSRSFIKLTYAAAIGDKNLFEQFAKQKNIRFWEKAKPPTDLSKLFEYHAQQAKLYKKYLQKLGLLNQDFYTFELGWRGTTVYYLLKLIKEVYGYKHTVTPLYFGSTATTPPEIKTLQKTYAIKDSQPADLFGFIESYIAIFEFMFSAPHGRFLGLNKHIQPVWKKTPSTHTTVQKYFEKALPPLVYQFYKKNPRILQEPVMPAKDLLQPFIDFATRKDYKDLKEWSKLYLEIGVFAEYMPFVPSVSKKEFLQMRNSQIKKLMQRALWPYTIFIKDTTRKQFYELLRQKGVEEYMKQGWKPDFRYILASFNMDKIKRIMRNPGGYIKTLWQWVKG